MIRGLRLKLIGINMLIVVILLAVMLGMVMTFTRTRISQDSIAMMHDLAREPMRPFRPDRENEDVNLPFFRLTLSRTGELLSCEGGYYDLSDEAILEELITAVQAQGKETGVLRSYDLRYLRWESPKETVLVFTDMTSETRALRHLLTACILIGIAGLALFLLVSILLSRWAVRPVERAWLQQKQFVGDASHELKTPLTVILTDTELLQSGSCTEEEERRFLASIRTMAEQMRGLVEELLSLTRADRSAPEGEMSMVDLSRCVSDAILPFEPVFFEKGLSVESEIEDGLIVRGSEAQFRQVTEILLDNAQKYSSPGTTTLRLLRKGRNCLLTVENPGESIPGDELEKIFHRFYRMDKVRSMNHSYGLGLAIARQIVENHRGKIWAENGDGTIRFLVQLPLAPAGGGNSP